MQQRRVRRLAGAIAGTLVGALLALFAGIVLAPSASAHGFIGNPASRAALCQQGVNTGCGGVQYEPQSVEGPKGFPASGPADGQIASGGGKFPALDAQTSTRWAKRAVTTGPVQFTWTYTAPHATTKWHYYITKQGWDPNAPLTRAALEPIGTVMHNGTPASSNPTHTITIPADRTGYHVILGVWDIADTGNAFYQVVDANIGGQAPADTQAPSQPGNLQASNVTATAATLSWSASTDNVAVTGYRVSRDGVQVASPTGTSFSDSGLSANTTYRYVVRAVDQAGNVSAASSELAVTTSAAPPQDTEAPTAPSGLHSMGVTSNSASLMWNASTDNAGVTGYDVFRNGTKIATTTSTSYNSTGLAANTSYAFTVKARDAAGNVSAASNELTVTTAAPPAPDTQAPSAPGNLASTSVTSSSVGLAWNAATDNVGVTEYQVFRNGTKVATTTSTSYNSTGLAANTAYAFTVKAGDAAGNISTASNTLNVTTAKATTYPTWSATKAYKVGDRVTYRGKNYVCIQAYKGNGDPNWINAPSLWRAL